MTEREWERTGRFRDMIAFLTAPPTPRSGGAGGLIRRAVRALAGARPTAGPPAPASDRKYRLLTAACCRRLWRTPHLPFADLPLYRDQGWLDRLERLADGGATPDDRAAIEALRAATYYPGDELPLRGSVDRPRDFWRMGPIADVFPAFQVFFPESSALGAELVRDVFGNPFRPAAFAPAWRTSAALDLARTMYEARDFAAMPILADALEEAGCDDAEVLAHCRAGGPHVRGCWVVDGVLDKT